MTAYIFLAEGFETVEALGTADVLRRGGVDVRLVSADNAATVTSSQKMAVTPDMPFDSVRVAEDDVMVFPGGMPGTKNLASNEKLISLACKHFADGGVVAAICAAPGLVGGQLPGLQGRTFTCFDGFEQLPVSQGAVFVKKAAVVSGNLVTGRSAGYYIDFGLAILGKVSDEQTVTRVREAMLLPLE